MPSGQPESHQDSYSRVTDPERFGILHQHALDLLARLESDYDVTRAEIFEPVTGLTQPIEHARSPVTLTPSSTAAASLGIAFTTFPGLVVRYGRWHAEPFPLCGCDACAATGEGEIRRLNELVDHVVGGTFSEELRIPLLGMARLVHILGSDGPASEGRSEGWTCIPRDVARELAGRGSRRMRWEPWPRRRGQPKEHAQEHAPAD